MKVLATGQTRCHDASGSPVDCAGTGQDAELRPGLVAPGQRFEVRGGTVLDQLTGLTWTRSAAPASFPLPWQEGADFCAGLELDDGERDRGGWRLPTRSELRSLVSLDAANPALPPDHPFENVFSGWYWTATPSALTPGYRWRVQLSGARMFHGAPDDPCMIWPVRGESAVVRDESADMAGRFERQGEEVLDALTGLIWTRKADLAGPLLWQQALDAASSLGRGWRLPTINELESLTDVTSAFPALPGGHPFTDLGEVYWSSTSSAFEPDWAMAYYLEKGAVGVGFKPGPDRFLAWAVRD